MKKNPLYFLIALPATATLLSPTPVMGTGGCPNTTQGDRAAVATAVAIDPNALTGPAGFGEKNYIPANSAIPYRIEFENDAQATAPAQVVDITNPLANTLDWSSFRLTEIGFGDQLIAVPPAQAQNFQTTVSMTDSGITFDVLIRAGIDRAAGKVYAHFESVDPETGWTPPVEVGFLPPENGTGRGMGHLDYTIQHVAAITENTTIRNIALIVFDQGEQIYTNQIDPHDPTKGTDPKREAPVTIDRGQPSSRIVFLPKETASKGFTVQWEGEDSGSGIAGFNIYSRDTQVSSAAPPGNQGDGWRLWLNNTSATSAVFPGLGGHAYEFYSVAIDHVGQVEEKLPVSEAKIFVIY